MLFRSLGPSFWPGLPRCVVRVLGAVLTRVPTLGTSLGLHLVPHLLRAILAQQQLAVLAPEHATPPHALLLVCWPV